MKWALLVVDTITRDWAWAHMARGIAKYSPEDDYYVHVVDQTGFGPLTKDLSFFTGILSGICHFSWTECAIPQNNKPFICQKFTTVVASHGVEYPFPVTEEEDVPSVIATRLRNKDSAEERLPRFDGVLCVSDRLQGVVSPYTPKAVRVVPGVDHEVFEKMLPPAREKIRIGWCGQLPGTGKNNTKGFKEVLVPLVARLQGKVQFIVNPRTAKNALSQADMVRWYAGVDLVISTSCSEGFQMPLLEGASCGRPCIATDVGAAGELVREGETGFIVPGYRTKDQAATTVDAFEEAIGRFIRERRLVNDMGAAAREVVLKNYTWKQRSPEWLKEICA